MGKHRPGSLSVRTIKLILQYDGANYAGWQIQDNAETVQELVEDALAVVLQEKVRVAGASRTDSGVHALGQVAAFRTSNPLPFRRLIRSLNGILPEDIRVLDISETDEGFVPRYAKEKTYRYAIACGEVLPAEGRRHTYVGFPVLTLVAVGLLAHALATIMSITSISRRTGFFTRWFETLSGRWWRSDEGKSPRQK